MILVLEGFGGGCGHYGDSDGKSMESMAGDAVRRSRRVAIFEKEEEGRAEEW